MENKRLVMCTSSGCLQYGPEEYRKLPIKQFHIMVNYDDKDYFEGLDLDPWAFFKYEATIEDPKNHLPHSAVPSTESIRQKYQEAIDEGYNEVIIITLSAYLGGTNNLIRLVGEEFKDKLKITIIDSRTCGFGEGRLAIQAYELVEKGVDTETIVKELNWSIQHQEFIGACSKLDYLIYNGRLKGGAAFMGKMIGITPVMHFSHEGVLEAFDKKVGIKKGVRRCCEEIKAIIGDRDPKDYYLWHNYTGEGSADIYYEIEKEYGLVCNHEDTIMTPCAGCHTGPFLAGYGLYMKRREDEPLE